MALDPIPNPEFEDAGLPWERTEMVRDFDTGKIVEATYIRPDLLDI